MRSRFSGKLKKPALLLLTVIAIATLWWYCEPWFRIEALAWDVDEGVNTSKASERLAALGPRAIGPILEQIGNRTPYSKSAAALPGVLRRMGEPAHKELLAAIDRTSDYEKRSYYIFTLHIAFHDFSRLPRWLDDAKRHPDDYSTIRHSLFPAFGYEVPYVDVSKKLSPDFLDWYKRHTTPRGPLPVWHPNQSTLH